MKVAIYARVSTEEQNTDNQIPLLLKAAESRGWEVYKVYEEKASAWKVGHQTELKALLKVASTHGFQVVLVWSLDRITREGIGTIMGYVNTLKKYGVALVSLQEPWTEQAGPMAELLYAVTAWIAKFESDRKSARIKVSLDKRRAKGLPVGRQPGAKDKEPRKRTGYLLRHLNRRK